MNNKGTTKIVLSVLLVIFLFFTWIDYSASTGMGTLIFSSEAAANGFDCIIPIFVPILLVIFSFMSKRNVRWNNLIFYGSIAGLIISFFNEIYYSIRLSSKVEGVSSKSTWALGFWLSLIVYIVLFVITLKERKKEKEKPTDDCGE